MTVGLIQLGRCEYRVIDKQRAEDESLRRAMTWPVGIQRIYFTRQVRWVCANGNCPEHVIERVS
jgi:hypothetical protein